VIISDKVGYSLPNAYYFKLLHLSGSLRFSHFFNQFGISAFVLGDSFEIMVWFEKCAILNRTKYYISARY
jgi:hypothetical protein